MRRCYYSLNLLDGGGGPFQENRCRSVLAAGDALQVVVLNIYSVPAHLAGPFLRWQLTAGVGRVTVFREDRYFQEAGFVLRPGAERVVEAGEVCDKSRDTFVVAYSLRSGYRRFVL